MKKATSPAKKQQVMNEDIKQLESPRDPPMD